MASLPFSRWIVPAVVLIEHRSTKTATTRYVAKSIFNLSDRNLSLPHPEMMA